jgi:dipeptidyl aminopeptidase/acylaminoacyl peptidase
MNRKWFLFGIPIILIFFIVVAFISRKEKAKDAIGGLEVVSNEPVNPLQIIVMRKRNYPGSDIVIEKTLEPTLTYNQYIASYMSDGLKIYALLTVPKGSKPQNGWPVILFNHGYIPPDQYQTTERYVAYVDAFAKNGYIVFKPDFRGNGNSEGKPEGAYYSPAYTVDDLNALSSIKKLKDPLTYLVDLVRPGSPQVEQAGSGQIADPNRIGVWGHSMGGNITFRDLVVNTTDIKAAVIWGGVVGSYNNLINNWQRKVTFNPGPRELALRNNNRQNLIDQYKTPNENPGFWNSIDPTYFTSDITASIQLDVGGADEEVPVAFSESLNNKLKAEGKTVEYYVYPGSDHNIKQGFSLAMQRSVDFFDKYLKQ